MVKLDRHPFRRGVVLTEACVGLALIGLVLAMASLLLTQHARVAEHFLNYRRAQLAAESCVEKMRIGAAEVIDANFADEAGVTYRIRVYDAEPAWRPLRRVTVLTKVGGVNGRAAQYSLSAYLDPTRLSPEKQP